MRSCSDLTDRRLYHSTHRRIPRLPSFHNLEGRAIAFDVQRSVRLAHDELCLQHVLLPAVIVGPLHVAESSLARRGLDFGASPRIYWDRRLISVALFHAEVSRGSGQITLHRQKDHCCRHNKMSVSPACPKYLSPCCRTIRVEEAAKSCALEAQQLLGGGSTGHIPQINSLQNRRFPGASANEN